MMNTGRPLTVSRTADQHPRFWPLIAIALFSLTRMTLAQPMPPPPEVPAPTPNFPAAFDPFNTPADDGAPHDQAPTLGDWTKTAAPGDTIVLTGSRLSLFAGNALGRDMRFTVFGQSGPLPVVAEAAIQHLSGDLVAVTLPTNLPPWSTYLLWPGNEAGNGTPAVLNQTEAWWIGPDVATRGEFFSVYGRNLSHGGGETRGWVYLQSTLTGVGQWLASTSANPYKVDFLLPADVATGTYRVWAHNGHGGVYGWAQPLTLTVDGGLAWNNAASFDVRAYGAIPNDNLDDAIAIRNTLAAAGAAPGSTVYLPAGNYLLRSPIYRIPPATRILGDGMHQTVLRGMTNFPHESFGMISCSLDRVEFRDLTLDTDGTIDTWRRNTLIDMRGSDRVRFTNVRFSQFKDLLQGPPIDMDRSHLVVFRGCEFDEVGGIFLGKGRQLHFDDCAFRGVNDNIAMVYQWGAAEVSFTRCTAADYDNSNPNDPRGWAQGRWIAGAGIWGANRNMYVGNNRTIDLTVRPGFWNQNTGEQFMFEAMDTLFRAVPLAADQNTVRFAGLTNTYAGEVMVVVGGTGLGQSRTITGGNLATGTLTVDLPWNLPPDTASTVVIGQYMTHMALYGNAFDGKPSALSNNVACSGVEPFGGCVDIVVASNSFHELRTGISNFSLPNQLNGRLVTEPNFFNLFADNAFDQCRVAMATWVDRYDNLPITYDPCMLGNSFRGNRILNCTETALPFYTRDPNPSVYMNVFARNTGTNLVRFANLFPSASRDQVFVGNQCSGNGRDAAVCLTSNGQAVVRDNLYTGFTANYSGYPPGGLLEAPRRAIRQAAATNGVIRGALTLWNSGTASLSWTGSANVPWLTLDLSGGSLANERSAASVPFTTQTTGLQPGTNTAQITVLANAGQTRQFNLEFEVPFPTTTEPPLNGAPEATEIAVSSLEDTAATLNLAATDADGDALTYAIATAPRHGTLGPISGTSLEYMPAPNYNGPDSFTYQAHDGKTNSNLATVSLNMTAVNDPPTLNTFLVSPAIGTAPLNVSVTASATDVDGDALVYAWNFGDGQSDTDPAFNHIFAAAGTFPVILTVTDGQGASISNAAAVSVAQPTVSVTIYDAIMAEPADPGTFRFNLDKAQLTPVTMSYALSGSALRGIDYSTPGGSIVIPAGSVSGDLVVTPLEDDLNEGTETVTLTLQDGAGYAASGGQKTIDLRDTDRPELMLVTSDSSANETGNDTARFTAIRSPVTSSALLASFTVRGTASNGQDYAWLDGLVWFPPGTAAVVVTINPLNDVEFEGDENVMIALAANDTYTLGTTSSGTATIVDDELRAADSVTGLVSGLRYNYYTGRWNALPDFSSLTPSGTGMISNFSLTPRTVRDNFGFEFTGYIEVPADGQYTFFTTSNEGSKLFIGDTEIVNNDGVHGAVEKSGMIGLRAGKHAIRIVYFERRGSELLQVMYAGPGLAKQLVPDPALSTMPLAGKRKQ